MKQEIIKKLKAEIYYQENVLKARQRNMKRDKDFYKPYWKKEIKETKKTIDAYKKAISLIRAGM